MAKRRIYMDYAATTPLDAAVGRAIRAAEKAFGNPSSVHLEGVAAKKALDGARKDIARLLAAHSDEIVFTSGGTEANNLALLGVLAARSGENKHGNGQGVTGKKPHVITTVIEHASVLMPLRSLESSIDLTILPVGENGIVRTDDVKKALRPETALVSIQYANNEIGTIQPVREIAACIQKHNAVTGSATIFHVDASQAPLYLSIDAHYVGADLMTFDAHKIYGPKGVGLLYVRRGTKIRPMMLGGGQERGMRSTTENVPLIAGLAKAIELAVSRRERESKRLRSLRDYCIQKLSKELPSAIINGDKERRLPNNVNISVQGLDAEFAVIKLDAKGIACSTKSSCLRDEAVSYVIEALGYKERASSSLRFTFGKGTTKTEIDRVVRELQRLVSSV